jgi:hypothetical protein
VDDNERLGIPFNKLSEREDGSRKFVCDRSDADDNERLGIWFNKLSETKDGSRKFVCG